MSEIRIAFDHFFASAGVAVGGTGVSVGPGVGIGIGSGVELWIGVSGVAEDELGVAMTAPTVAVATGVPVAGVTDSTAALIVVVGVCVDDGAGPTAQPVRASARITMTCV
jgi:hypothetical protein